MLRTSAAALSVLVLLASVGFAEAQDRKWTLLRSFIETEEFPGKHYFGGKKIKVDVYLSGITRLSSEMIEVEVLEDYEIPSQPNDAPPWHSQGTVIAINCKNLHWKINDLVRYEFPMGQRRFTHDPSDGYLKQWLARGKWLRGNMQDAALKDLGGGKKAELFFNDIKRLCRK